MTDINKQEMRCTHCSIFIQFEIDLDLEGKYEIKCPKCGHRHYRTVKDNEFTEERWAIDMYWIKELAKEDSLFKKLYENPQGLPVRILGTFTHSVYYSSTGGKTSDFLRQSWFNKE